MISLFFRLKETIVFELGYYCNIFIHYLHYVMHFIIGLDHTKIKLPLSSKNKCLKITTTRSTPIHLLYVTLFALFHSNVRMKKTKR